MWRETFPFKKEEAPRFHFGEVERLRAPLEKILREIGPKIEKGEYQLLIGDDSSGRIPAWIMRKIIEDIYSEKGFPPIETVYLAGSGSLAKSENLIGNEQENKKKKISDFLKYITEDNEKEKMVYVGSSLSKALIVTDTIVSGSSLSPLLNSLKENGIEFDIAAISVWDPKRENLSALNIFYGEKDQISSVDGAPYLSGVKKETKKLFSQPRKNESLAKRIRGIQRRDLTDKEKELTHTTTFYAREDSTRLAKEIMEKYKREKHF